MKVIELAKAANVTAETVRYYTREGLLSAKRNPHNGYKVYDQDALQRLQFISKSRALGFSLKDIKDILQNVADGQSPCPLVRDLLQEKIQQTSAQIQSLQTQLSLMQSTYNEWVDAPDADADLQSVCPIINSVGCCHAND